MKTSPTLRKPGFTLLETVIAIGVLTVLLTGFMYVFAPAAAGIRKAINVQEADRLTTTLEKEMATLRIGEESNDIKTGFDKAFNWIKDSQNANEALFIYRYRSSMDSFRTDGTGDPVTNVQGKLPGQDYVVQTMVRRRSDSEFEKDVAAVEGSVYLVKCTQLVFDGSELTLGDKGEIRDPKPDGAAGGAGPDEYPEAVIAFSAEFFSLPSKAVTYFSGSAFTQKFNEVTRPVFSRNLAVRR